MVVARLSHRRLRMVARAGGGGRGGMGVRRADAGGVARGRAARWFWPVRRGVHGHGPLRGRRCPDRSRPDGTRLCPLCGTRARGGKAGRGLCPRDPRGLGTGFARPAAAAGDRARGPADGPAATAGGGALPAGLRVEPDRGGAAADAPRADVGAARAGPDVTGLCRYRPGNGNGRRGRPVFQLLPFRHSRHAARDPATKDFSVMTRMNGPLRIGIGGPVGAGKTTLTARLAERLKHDFSIGVITNDIYTQEDAEALMRMQILPSDRVIGVETGGCPHTAIREDASINLAAVAEMRARHPGLDIVLIESGGDNLSATFSPELADLTIYVIDVAAGEDIPRKGGPALTRSDILVINKADLAPHVGASLEVMQRDATRMRQGRPFVIASLKQNVGDAEIVDLICETAGLRLPA